MMFGGRGGRAEIISAALVPAAVSPRHNANEPSSWPMRCGAEGHCLLDEWGCVGTSMRERERERWILKCVNWG